MPTPFQNLHKRWRKEAEVAKTSATRRKRRKATPPPATEDPGTAAEPAPIREEDAS